MQQIPIHIQVYRLLRHVTSSRIELTTPKSDAQLVLRMKRKERHQKKTERLVQGLQRDLGFRPSKFN